MERPCVIAGNWKMHKTVSETVDFIDQLKALLEDLSERAKCREVYLSVPYTSLYAAAKQARRSALLIGAQNMHEEEEGAFTGEISYKMLKEAGAQFVILGHSERRSIFQESSSLVNKKLKKALEGQLKAILCVGESLEQREEGRTEQVVKDQLLSSLEGLDRKDLKQVILAYEPVWAIGTGKTATPCQAQQMHKFCREVLSEVWGEKAAAEMIIQYGGSVKPENTAELLKQEDIDGVLVGGASLDPQVFHLIVNFDRSVVES